MFCYNQNKLVYAGCIWNDKRGQFFVVIDNFALGKLRIYKKLHLSSFQENLQST